MSAVVLSDTHAVSPSVELIASIEVHNGYLHSATAVLTQMIARVALDVSWRPDSFLHELKLQRVRAKAHGGAS